MRSCAHCPSHGPSCPERIFISWRIAVRNSLAGSGMPLEEAEFWLVAWELDAATREIPTTGDFWTVGDAWIAEEWAAQAKERLRS